MEFYDKTKPLYSETDESGVGLGASLLQTRNCTIYPRDKTPDNNIHKPIALGSKSLSSAEKKYRNIERSIRYITQPGRIPSLLLCKRSEFNYRPQATGDNNQERRGNIITNTTAYTPIRSQDNEEAWPRSLHCRLAIQTKNKEDKNEEIAGIK